MDIPVYLVAGFLDSGKTSFINGILEDGFAREDKTLLICCEEGDTEYDPELLKKTNTILVNVESMDEISPERLTELELLHNPERVLMEWNGMWNQDDLKLPKDWTIYQQITIIDMSTFELYVKNMKSLLNAMVKNSELIICNRCDGIEDLDRYKRMLKSMNTKCDIVFEDENGEIDLTALEPGAYTVEEITAPNGYLMDDDKRIIQINAGENARFVFTNTEKPVLSVVKYDAENDTYLAGATFRIAKIEDGSHYLDRVTDTNGRISISGLASIPSRRSPRLAAMC